VARHALYVPDLADAGEEVTLAGEEARHASRVKRLRAGEAVDLLDGAGLVAAGRVARADRGLVVEVGSRRRVERPRPAVEVWASAPKGPRLSTMIDLLSEVGAEAWTPLRTERANLEPTVAKRDRLARVAVEAMKQCRRAWLLEVRAPAGLDDALAGGAGVVLADPAGEPYEPIGAERVRVLVGPEGGFTPAERDRARRAGVQLRRFGPHVMRVEVAAAVACAIVLDRERGQPG